MNINPLYNDCTVDLFIHMGGGLMSRVVRVTPKDDYCLEIALDNGNRVVLDFTSRLHTVRFSILSDKDYFKTVTTDGAFVRWNYRIEISLREVFELVQK